MQADPWADYSNRSLDFVGFSALKASDNSKISCRGCAVCFLSSVLCPYKSEAYTAVHTCRSVTWIGQRCSRNIGFLVLIDSRSPRSKHYSPTWSELHTLQEMTSSLVKHISSVLDSTRRRVHARVSMSLLYLVELGAFSFMPTSEC